MLSGLSQAAWAQDVFVFPAQGQSNQQMQQDQAACQVWATQQTGFNPNQASSTMPPPPPSTGGPFGGVVRGGATGAAMGAVGGAITGNAGRGAAAGAATGALLGGITRADQNRRDAEATRQWAQQQAAAQSAERDRFNRAFRACLEGKGYSVN
jgi:hypothetical protein